MRARVVRTLHNKSKTPGVESPNMFCQDKLRTTSLDRHTNANRVSLYPFPLFFSICVLVLCGAHHNDNHRMFWKAAEDLLQWPSFD